MQTTHLQTSSGEKQYTDVENPQYNIPTTTNGVQHHRTSSDSNAILQHNFVQQASIDEGPPPPSSADKRPASFLPPQTLCPNNNNSSNTEMNVTPSSSHAGAYANYQHQPFTNTSRTYSLEGGIVTRGGNYNTSASFGQQMTTDHHHWKQQIPSSQLLVRTYSHTEGSRIVRERTPLRTASQQDPQPHFHRSHSHSPHSPSLSFLRRSPVISPHLTSISNTNSGEEIESFLLPLSASPGPNGYGGTADKNTVSTYDQNQEMNQTDITAKSGFLYYIIYALINTTMSIPCLYGYASVIFNHSVFLPYIASLSKLVIWSSAVHQLSFVAFSSLPFAKAEVQDAGLIFLSFISNQIANTILNDPENNNNNSSDESGEVGKEIISTTIVALGIATGSLGVVLVLLGKFRCANAVSYLPLPVVGGYLAFIGYFCVIAGVGLCTSKSMVDGGFLSDMKLLMATDTFLLALPGLLSGFLLMIVARYAKSEIALPATMVLIPVSFYVVLAVFDITLEEARDNMWVGKSEPPAPITALLDLLDLSKVRWDAIFSSNNISTWFGMVFVVSFSSCLDVAAISMDMGEALDVNKELTTVGLSNVVSGLLLGQTGSYIFSQTIFTYRTGYHSRWVGFIGALSFLALVVSTINLLEISPLFFLGSTLIFIGVDLLYEWLIEVRHKLLLSEYCVLLATFLAIQVLGLNGGIVFGMIVAVVDYVVTTSKISSLRRVLKHSRVVWQPERRQLLSEIVYNPRDPKILTLEVKETIFFGSALQLLANICDEIGISTSPSVMEEIIFTSPRHHSSPAVDKTCISPSTSSITATKRKTKMKKCLPTFVVLDLSEVPNVDASAARGCFLQLAKICQKERIILCASGSNPRVDWILRSHDVAYSYENEDRVKESMLTPLATDPNTVPSGKVILFDTIYEALELCENKVLFELEHRNAKIEEDNQKNTPRQVLPPPLEENKNETVLLSTIFCRILQITEENDDQRTHLKEFDDGGSFPIPQLKLLSGDLVFASDTSSDAFYVVLVGCVGIFRDDNGREKGKPAESLSGSIRRIGSRQELLTDEQQLGEAVSYLNVGGVFGFVDFKLNRRRTFSAAASRDGTVIAKVSHSMIDRLKGEDTGLYNLIEKVLLQASLMELANLDVT